MHIEPRRPPVAVCNRCGAFSYSVRTINQQCKTRQDLTRCSGFYGIALGIENWRVCHGCAGGGIFADGRCIFCKGAGWFYSRGRA